MDLLRAASLKKDLTPYIPLSTNVERGTKGEEAVAADFSLRGLFAT